MSRPTIPHPARERFGAKEPMTDATRLEALVMRADRGRIDFDGLRELARRYRAQTGRLSLLRTRGDDPEAVRALNDLCLRAHAHVSAPPPRIALRNGFWLRQLPGALGRTLKIQLGATGLLLLGALLGALLVLRDADHLAITVPARMYDPTALRHLHDTPAAQEAFLARKPESFASKTLFAGGLFAHNSRIGLLSFAVGILGGLPTLALLVYNGLTLGGFGMIFLRGPQAVPFLAWLIPHAIPELLAIILCATGGLAMGLAMLAPGRVGRRVAVRDAARDAFQLVIASLPLFVMAAVIESFVRQSTLSTAFRLSLAACSILCLCAYVWLVRTLAARAARVDVSFLGGSHRGETVNAE